MTSVTGPRKSPKTGTAPLPLETLDVEEAAAAADPVGVAGETGTDVPVALLKQLDAMDRSNQHTVGSDLELSLPAAFAADTEEGAD